MGSAPPLSEASLEARRRLAALAARYHGLGWMLGTSGNLSARVEAERVVVTASGCDKGLLTEEDFVEVDLEGGLLASGPGRRPSAETSIHLAIYGQCPEVMAALHVHTVDSSLLPRGAESPSCFDFTGYEMVKGWGLWDEGLEARLPIFENHADVPKIALEVKAWLETPSGVPALVIERHGITAWGATIDEAHRHVEITEFLCGLQRSSMGAQDS